MEELPRDFTKMFDYDVFKFDVDLIPQAKVPDRTTLNYCALCFDMLIQITFNAPTPAQADTPHNQNPYWISSIPISCSLKYSIIQFNLILSPVPQILIPLSLSHEASV